MVHDLLTAVTRQLGTTFGTDYHYYIEDNRQKLITPCFTVDVILPTERSKSPVLYDRTMPLVVHYFHNNQETIKKDCYKIAERTVECLEYLPFKGKLIRGENISWEIVDNVLQIYLTYKFSTMRVTEIGDPMELLDVTDTLTN